MSNPTPGDRPDGVDPRPRPDPYGVPRDQASDLRPRVAPSRAGSGLGLVLGGAAILGAITFIFLSSHRPQPKGAFPNLTGSAADIAPPPPAPPDLAAVEAAGRGVAAPAAPPLVALAPPPITTISPGPAPSTPPPAVETTGQKSPTLVVDLGDGPGPPAGAAPTGAPTAAKPADAARAGLNADEQFAERVSAAEPERSRATVIHNTRETIPQGAMIPGVLETALNSDLPGFARAVVSRDVRGFDGSVVLIPRGSRVIGQYKSAVSQGQSRAFVIWTRVIRPDGASIQIASSGTDPLGRAGLEGTVDRHFFEQFGGAILLSVIDAGVASLARAPSTQVVIGSSTGASGIGVGATALQPTAISPTIKVPQGAAIRIFVARDLDFTPVGAVK